MIFSLILFCVVFLSKHNIFASYLNYFQVVVLKRFLEGTSTVLYRILVFVFKNVERIT